MTSDNKSKFFIIPAWYRMFIYQALHGIDKNHDVDNQNASNQERMYSVPGNTFRSINVF